MIADDHCSHSLYSEEFYRFHQVVGLVYVSNETVLAVDRLNSRLRQIDLQANEVSSICVGNGTADGDRDSCRFNSQLSDIILFRNAIFITDGQVGKLRRLKVQGLGEVVPQRPCTMTYVMT